MYHQPRSGDFALRVHRRTAGNFQTLGLSAPGQMVKLVVAQHGILEKRTCAAAVRVSGYDQHAFALTNLPHCSPYLREGRGITRACEMLLQIRILQAGTSAWCQAIGDARDDVSSALCGVEDAGAISEAASHLWKSDRAIVLHVECVDGLDRVRNFLSVSSHVLHWSAADASGDSAQAFHSGAILVDCACDELVPIHARADLVNHGAAFL